MISGLESANLKLIRAAVHIEEVKYAILAYTGTEPSGLTRQPNGSQKVQFDSSPNPDIAILAGEAVYQIRSALDHLAFDLVKLNHAKIKLPLNWEKHCEFPLLTKVPTTGNPPVPRDLPLAYNFWNSTLPGISKQAFTFIESVQPYYGTEVALPIRWLAELSNIDKHRHLNVTKPQALIRHKIAFSDGRYYQSIRRKQHGAKVEPLITEDQMTRAVNMQYSFTPFVSFDESAVGLGPSEFAVEDILQACLNVVKRLIVPTFEKFINNP